MLNSEISVAIITNGGAGTLLFQTNFIKYFKDYVDDDSIKIIVFGHSSKEINDAVFRGQSFIDEYYSSSQKSQALTYDVCINIHIYPEVLYKNDKKIKRHPKLNELLNGWIEFLEIDRFRSFRAKHPFTDVNSYIYAVLIGKNCLSISDVDGKLKIGNEYSINLNISIDEKETLDRFGLEKKMYITLQRGATPSLALSEVPKVWPIEYYNELIRLIKIVYPQIKLVQVGESFDRSEEMKGIDANLVGETKWEELEVILKNSYLHIDGECGMVHFRKVLGGGPSVVIFGPTPIDFYGYKDNINIAATNDECNHWCARVQETWQERCYLGKDKPPCMISLTPKMVMERIVAYNRLNEIGGNLYINESKSYLKKLSRSDIHIDDDYRRNYIQRYDLYHAETKKVKLKTLRVAVLVDDSFVWKKIIDSPAYLMLMGDKSRYSKYVNNLKEKNNDCIHTIHRYEKLIDDLNINGYNSKNIIITDSNLRVMDGQHRASWLLHKFGEDYEVEVLQIYWCFNLFPFQKVEKGSNVVIYGFGGIGKAYIQQIRFTKYCNFLYVVDREYENKNFCDSYRNVSMCFPVEKIAYNHDEYDYVVIAAVNDRYAYEMKNKLIEMNVPESKIICKFEP